MFARIGTTFSLAVLQFAIDHFIHDFLHQAFAITSKQWVPMATPKDFDDIPSSTAENSFQLLDDFGVTTNRSIETLQITVDHENQVIKTFAPSEADRTQGFRFVHLSIAEECPNFAIWLIREASIHQILHDMGLVDRLNRSETH